ncbi:MAG: tRNA (adenosine(37)-N6)-threonylcarbamoyltransferase complex transferase subunit TsaD [Ruminococcaceae bacterium]|nr:tRNA (adenosine(37)-N6)-threonylcarbamoyltransferase complex transferase subunit TsaD [Oscillospiraceae bacterium]
MLILAIESSCDETAAAVVRMSEDERTILSNIVASQVETHALYGGVVPEIASRAHIEAVSPCVEKAVSDAGVTLSDIDAVAVTYSPGLIGCLLVGVNFAKSLAFSLGVPLIPVDHIRSHTAAAYFTDAELQAPFLSLVVSGGHTSLYSVPEPATYEEIGSTRDDAAGEAFDKVGRVMGLTYPGGAAMDALAREGFEARGEGKRKKEDYIRFPSPAINDDTFDYSFSGLKTAAVNHIHNLRQKAGLSDKAPIDREEMAEIACAFTESVVDGICKKLALAIEETKTERLVLAGGVAANSHLREGIAKLCKKKNIKLYMPSLSLCGDNGAMVGAQAYYEYLSGVRGDTDLNAYASGEGAEAARAIHRI